MHRGQQLSHAIIILPRLHEPSKTKVSVSPSETLVLAKVEIDQEVEVYNEIF